MVIGILYVDLHVPESGSLKAKRGVIKSLTVRLRNKFNISVSEIDNLDKWQRAGIGVSIISNDRAYVDSVLEKVLMDIEAFHRIVLIDCKKEIL